MQIGKDVVEHASNQVTLPDKMYVEMLLAYLRPEEQTSMAAKLQLELASESLTEGQEGADASRNLVTPEFALHQLKTVSWSKILDLIKTSVKNKHGGEDYSCEEHKHLDNDRLMTMSQAKIILKKREKRKSSRDRQTRRSAKKPVIFVPSCYKCQKEGLTGRVTLFHTG